jgi:hypothetical protein
MRPPPPSKPGAMPGASLEPPKGTLAVLEYLREEVESEPSASALIGLHYFLTSKAAAYTPAEVEGFLDDAGFKITKTQPIRRLPLQTLILAQPE